MRNLIPKLFFLAFFTALVLPSRACNLSYAAFCGFSTNPMLVPGYPNDTVLCLTLCTGYGRTGNVYGAGGDTRSILFGWYDSNPGFIIRAFTPASITSGRGFADCTMPGSDIGPQGPPIGSQGTVLYADPGYYGTAPCVNQPFGCITTTALCGTVAQQCITYYFQVNQVPDSTRVFGVEGGGNPLAGCYPDADMLVIWEIQPVVWGGFEATPHESVVRLNWSTIQETNTDFFMVTRATGNGDFEPIGTVRATGNSTSLQRYEFVDLAPVTGTNRYRVHSYDLDAQSMATEIIEANFSMPGGLQWGAVGPVPAHDKVHITFYTDLQETMNLRVFDASGKTVISKSITSKVGPNEIQLAMSTIQPGVYYVSVQGGSGKLTHKVVKL